LGFGKSLLLPKAEEAFAGVFLLKDMQTDKAKAKELSFDKSLLLPMAEEAFVFEFEFVEEGSRK
jgi:hypothetical protein